MNDSIITRVIENIEERRKKLDEGGINSIPSPFERFSNDFIGVEQGKYYLITSSSKGAKTQFASFTFLFEPLMYSYEHPDQVDLKIFYYPLEETPEGVIRRFMSYLLYKLDGIRCSPTQLLSTNNSRPVPDNVIRLLQSEKYQKILNFFNSKVTFSVETNPTGIYKEMIAYAEATGTTYYKTKTYKDKLGNAIHKKEFDVYIPNNPKQYNMLFVDHISLLIPEKGNSRKDNIDLFSGYMVDLRNKYNFTPVLIQQQSMESESIDAINMKRRPSQNTLGDSKYTGRDCNMLLGLYSPAKHGLQEYQGYDISRLKEHVRFLEVVLNRDGIQGGMIALFFDGETCYFNELPRANEPDMLEKIYNYVQNITYKAITFFSILKKVL